MKKFVIFCILSVFFTGVVFVYKNYFFSVDHTYIENNYIEETIQKEEVQMSLNSPLIDHGAVGDDYKIHYSYIPEDFENKIQEKKDNLEVILRSEDFESKISYLDVELYEDKVDVRGKMKNHSVKLFGGLDMDEFEFLGVGIHEFAHYVDLYYLKKKVVKDISDEFYNISWSSTKVLLPGQTQEDFVSGYAMTNKYEDFAESFTYFVLHNKDFLTKAQESEELKKKYNFFTVYLFREDQFQDSDFSIGDVVSDYYRDITKIEYTLEKLLQYLKK